MLTTFVSNVPIISLVNCLVCAGFWGSAIFAVWLYRRLTPSLTQRQAVIIGLLTGVFAGLFGFLLTFVGLAGMQGFINQLGQTMSPEDLEGIQNMPAWAAPLFNLFGVAFNIAFGALGGLIGGAIFRTDKQAKPQDLPA